MPPPLHTIHELDSVHPVHTSAQSTYNIYIYTYTKTYIQRRKRNSYPLAPGVSETQPGGPHTANVASPLFFAAVVPAVLDLQGLKLPAGTQDTA